MRDQYLYHEDSYPFTGSDHGQFINNAGARSPGNPYFEGDNEITYFEDFVDLSGHSTNFGDSSSFTANGDGRLSDITYSSIHNPEPEHPTAFCTDFGISDLTPHIEGNSYSTGNVGEFSYGLGEVVTPSFEDYDKAIYSTDCSDSGENFYFGNNSVFFGGAGEQFLHVADAEILNHAGYDAKAPLCSNTTPQSPVGPQNDHNYEDVSQSSEAYEIRPLSPNQENESSWQSRKRMRRTQSGDDYISERPEPNQPDETPSQPRKNTKRRKWSEDETDKLMTWRNNGMSYEQIGEKLDRTVDSCRRHRYDTLKRNKIQAQQEAEAAARAPKDVPILRMKDASSVEGGTPGQKGIDRVDWAVPRVKDKKDFDLKTPGLKEWVHGRLKTIRYLQDGGPWTVAWNIVAEELNKANNTDLTGRNLIDAMPY